VAAQGTTFPQGFVWGVAASAYQIEGAAKDDGRGESIWDRFSRTPGKTQGGDTGDVACDHYHRYREDVALMRDLGVRAYRFSLAWPRVIPLGTGKVNDRGVDFYRRLVDELLASGIEPWACLYHWDLPQACQDKGGWANPEVVRWFADYAAAVGRALGDRVKRWVVLNEPRCIAWLGHLTGEHAPGLTDRELAVKVSRHLLLAQGQAVHALREVCPGASVGTVLDLNAVHPLTSSPEDRAAGERWDQFWNRWFLDPLLKGEIPPLAREAGLTATSAELKVIRAPVDFLGINYYSRALLAHDPSAPPLYARWPDKKTPVTEMGWEIYPRGLYEVLTRIQRDYGNPEMYVTENGAAFSDIVVRDGAIQDDDRIAYLRDHVAAVHRAIRDGARVKGYFVWSILDNFEWAWGYGRRFGIVHVDFRTLKRTPKASYRWYKEVIAHNGPASLDLV
jgi:beta-glucosidase